MWEHKSKGYRTNFPTSPNASFWTVTGRSNGKQLWSNSYSLQILITVCNEKKCIFQYSTACLMELSQIHTQGSILWHPLISETGPSRMGCLSLLQQYLCTHTHSFIIIFFRNWYHDKMLKITKPNCQTTTGMSSQTGFHFINHFSVPVSHYPRESYMQNRENSLSIRRDYLAMISTASKDLCSGTMISVHCICSIESCIKLMDYL